jgi:hypothetical protein
VATEGKNPLLLFLLSFDVTIKDPSSLVVQYFTKILQFSANQDSQKPQTLASLCNPVLATMKQMWFRYARFPNLQLKLHGMSHRYTCQPFCEDHGE